MKKLKTGVVLALVVLLLSSSAIAQISNVSDVGGKPIMTKKYSKIEGSPYYFGTNNWFEGTLYTADGKQINNVSIRYNGYDDEIEYKKDGNILVIDNYNLKGFDFYAELEGGNVKYEFRNGFYVAGEIDKKDFFNVIYKGENISLLEKFKVIETRVTPASYGASEYQKFVNDKVTILVFNDKADQFKNRKKDFYNIAPSKKAEIKQVMKENDLDLNNSRHVAFLLEFIENKLL
ncbi:hypothetical protein JKA74_08185 [Marivirga sp. S37H4]|uniref:Uncharacterized protein n=1 Tax=Marivirga aurantiaca TaxID=2802615 RepID=A0A934WXL3_9BACT|nr:hypothetical protein [Marivirga aurantiaca]MBK6265013.1 hypothetical protein [Marivirga aurantiaca]